MRILLIGASGFIGSACLARLAAQGFEVRALARAPLRGGPAGVEWVRADLASMTTPEAWSDIVKGCDAVVNAAGVFADTLKDSTRTVHVDAPRALYSACQSAGVRRVVLVSAIGVQDRRTAFAQTKLEGELALQECDLDWVILRPSVVLGEAAYGGSALIRGLASLPVLPLEPDLGRIQPVQLDDVVDTIMRFLDPGARSRVTLELTGPERMEFPEVVAAYRRWLGWKPARVLRLPGWLMAPVYLAGDIANWLGWRTPVSNGGRKELLRGAEGDGETWRRTSGVNATPLSAALALRPSSLQERRFAEFYFLKPMVIIVTALFWIATGITSLGPGYAVGIEYMERGGAGVWAAPSVIAGGVADLAIGIGILIRATTRLALIGAILISLFYAVAGTAILPELWLDPIGPMLKIWPLIAFNIVALALVRDR